MNLLTDELLRVQASSGLYTMSLPALMSALGRDDVVSLPGIQRHQEDAFHVFLCYLAGVILSRRGHTDSAQPEEYWLKGLRELTGEVGDDAWMLVVNDPCKPAFMQPPIPIEDHGRLKVKARTPDELDLLPTAKNHDLKQARATCSTPDGWIYSLISLQTMSGYFGRGNPGISRMNRGHGNRPLVELCHSIRPGQRWRDAVERLHVHRGNVLAGAWGYDPQGLVLTWLPQWDGKSSFSLTALDPFYIEICRRVRLRGEGQIDLAEAVPCNANRVDAKALNGVVGDAWHPIDVGSTNDKALSISPQGLTAQVLRRLVFADGIRLSGMQQPLTGKSETAWLSVSVLVRGQGTTDGYHEKRVPIPAHAQRRLLGSTVPGDPLATLSRSAIDYAGKMQNSVLKPAIFSLIQGGPDKVQLDRDSAQSWWQRFGKIYTTRWSDAFFPWLWDVPTSFVEEDILKDWARWLRTEALEVLNEAQAALPLHSGRHYRICVQANRMFWSALYSERNFPFLREAKERNDERIANTK